MSVFKPEEKRRKRDGYDDGDYILFKRVPVGQFIHSEDPISLLGSSNQFYFEGDDKRYVIPNAERKYIEKPRPAGLILK